MQAQLESLRRRRELRVLLELVATYVLVMGGLTIAALAWGWEFGRITFVLDWLVLSASVAWGPTLLLVLAIAARRRWSS